MIRIAHLTTAHPRFDVRIFHKECRSLASHGYHVDLYVADGVGSVQNNGILIIDVGRPIGRFNRMFRKPWAIWNAIRKTDARIIHVHDPELLPIALLLKWAGRTIIYDAHEDVPRQILSKPWIKPWLRHAIAWSFERLENFIALRCAIVICATPHIAARYAAQRINCIDVNNYPILEEFLDGAEIQESERQANDLRTICYIGGITETRGAVQMIQALEKTNARLILAGPMQSDDFFNVLKSMPGWRQVDYRGVLNRIEIRQVLSESRLGLVLLHPIPNYVDALPVKMFEYMAAGLPVLASDFPLWRKILDTSGVGQCVDPLNTDQIAQTISSMLDMPAEERKRMQLGGLCATREVYNWKVEETKLIAAYTSIVRS